jgi:methylisocitrate lyase
MSAGARLHAAVAEERPLQMVGAINAYAARLAAATGFRALYLAGSGVAVNSLGVPDLGISTMDDVLTDIRRITDACELPLLVDGDTGWGGACQQRALLAQMQTREELYRYLDYEAFERKLDRLFQTAQAAGED